jgi:hypothetical protein
MIDPPRKHLLDSRERFPGSQQQPGWHWVSSFTLKSSPLPPAPHTLVSFR